MQSFLGNDCAWLVITIKLRIQPDPQRLYDTPDRNQFGKGFCGTNGNGKQLPMPQVPIEQIEIILVRVNRHLNSRMRSVMVNDIAPGTVMPILGNVIAAGVNAKQLAYPGAVRGSCVFRQLQ